MASFTTVFLLMTASTVMNNIGLSKLPCVSPILTSNSSEAPSPTTTLTVVFSYTCPQPSSLLLLVLPSTIESPSLWVLCKKLSLGRRTPEPYFPGPPVSSLPSVSGRTTRLRLLSPSWTLAVFPRNHLLFAWSSSSSMACPDIWGRRYSWWRYSSMLPCLLSCPLSDPHLSCLSCMRLSILGLAALAFFSLVCPHLAFFSLCAPLSFWPYHLSRFSVIFLEACTTLVVPLMCSFRNLSLLVTPHIHRSILISFTSSRAPCPLVGSQFSAPYNRAGLTTVLSTFPFSFTGILLSHNTPLHLFPFFPCCTHSLWNFCCRASCLLHAWTIRLILASKTLSNSCSTWLSSVMPLYFPGSCTSPFLFHISSPSSTLSVSFGFPSAYTRSVAFLSTWLPPLQPSPTSLAALHLPLSPCLFHLVHCCFHFFLSYLLHFHLSPNRARELEATCCSFSIQQLLEVCRPHHQHFLTFCDESPVVIFDHRTSLQIPSILSSIPCHLEYHLFATIFVKLSVQFFLHTPPCSVHRPPGCLILLLLAIQVI